MDTTDTPAMTCTEIDAALHRLELRHGLSAMRTVASTLALALDSMAPGRLETLLGSVDGALDERGQR